MMRFLSFFTLALLGIAALLSMQITLHRPMVDRQDRVVEILQKLGAPEPAFLPDSTVDGFSVERGKSLVHKGFASAPEGGRTGRQSKHFVCTSCHNTRPEDPDLRIADPQARLEYARDHNLPFLPGTTLYGVVNRSSFYNGDYEKKYGDLVTAARNDLREAIQLCATECSQGRKLEDWEMESIIAYLWTIDLKLADLQMAPKDYEAIQLAIQGESDAEAARTLIRSYYLDGAPATFTAPPADRQSGYQLKGRPDNGKLIYDLSCKHCHENERYSFFELNDSPYTFQFLENHIAQYDKYSIYQVIRYGTYPVPGERSYMPNFTLEKMSHQQVEDLRAYIELKAKGGTIANQK